MNDDLGDSVREPSIPGLLKGFDAGLQFHLVVGGTFVSRMPRVDCCLAALRVDQDKPDPYPASSRRRKRRAIRVDVQRVFG